MLWIPKNTHNDFPHTAKYHCNLIAQHAYVVELDSGHWSVSYKVKYY